MAWSTLLLLAGLYTLAATLLLVRLGAHPEYAYNWEPYTAYGAFAFWDRPSPRILRATEGLMTDSSGSPLTILPIWLAFRLGGVGLWALRVGPALIAATAVPLLWWVGRRFVGAGAALLAAILLALSPVFLLYGRTATIVGLSLVPALVTIEALRRLLREPGDRRWRLALASSLIVGMYAYAPVRFLWPLAILFLAFEWWRRPAEERQFRRALLFAVAIPWAFLTVASLRDPFTALVLHYEGRGEHVFGLSFVPDWYGAYLRPDSGGQETAGEGRLGLAARLIAQNALDLGKLLIDRDTAPALTDSWNAHGRLYPAFLVPFAALGLLLTLAEARRRIEARLLLALAAIWTLPLIVTTKVHIGRLVFFLPILCLLVAVGAIWPCRWLATRATASGRRRAQGAAVGTSALLAVLLIGATALASWRDYREPPPSADVATVALLRAVARGASPPPAVALLYSAGTEDDPTDGVGEATRVAALRLHLDGDFRFIDRPLSGANQSTEGRIPLYYGGFLADPMPDVPCETAFYVAADAMKGLLARLAPRELRCGPPRVTVLP